MSESDKALYDDDDDIQFTQTWHTTSFTIVRPGDPDLNTMSKLNVLVDSNDVVLTSCIRFIADVLGGEKFNLVNHEKLYRNKQYSNAVNAEDLKLCHLPVIISDANDYTQVCYAGLCTVVRKMVHHTHDESQKEKSISLLGYQETCLKAYAEVSSWTSFCENDFPNAVNVYLNDHSPQNDKNFQADMPTVLLRLEKELATPKNLPNKSKFLGKEKAKWLTKLIRESFEGQKIGQSLQSYVSAFEEKINSCKSWSPYLIGFQITIADLLVLSMVASLFQKLSRHSCLCKLPESIPLVFEWIEMMKMLPSAKKFIESEIEVLLNSTDHAVGGSNINLCTSWFIAQNDVDTVSQTKSEQKNKKLKIDHQSNISITLEKLETCGIHADVSNLSDFQPSIDWKAYSDYLNPSKGDLNLERSLRKQQQISNILVAVKPLAKPGCRIVDFCAGGGHVGIVLAFFLQECEVVLIENKEESVLRAVKRIGELKLNNIKICHTNLGYFCGTFDVGVTLHACGVATDLVLNACYNKRASFVVCPCCYGSINDIESVSYPRSQKFRDKMTVEDYVILSRSSDMTTWDEKSTNCRFGRSSMAFVDLDRCSYMEELGYKTLLRAMVPKSCSPKHHLLIGTWTHNESVGLFTPCNINTWSEH